MFEGGPDVVITSGLAAPVGVVTGTGDGPVPGVTPLGDTTGVRP